MDVAKFLWLLQRRALHFSRLDKLGDPFEGHYTRLVAERKEEYVRRRVNETLPAASEAARSKFALDLEKSYDESLAFYRKNKATFYVSCWHYNEAESSAMWKLYTSMNDAVCVRTTYRSLWECLPTYTNLGLVQYVDYETEEIGGNLFNLVIHK